MQQIVHRQLKLRVHETSIRADLVGKAREFPVKTPQKVINQVSE